MIVEYTKTETFYVDTRMLEEYYPEIENIGALPMEEIKELFEFIPSMELRDICTDYFTVDMAQKVVD